MPRLRKWARRLLMHGSLVLTAILATCVWNLSQLSSRQLAIPSAKDIELDEAAMIERFQSAIRIATISKPLSRLTPDDAAYEFCEFVQASFPNLCSAPARFYTGKDFGDPAIPSMLLEWPGQDPDADGLLLMSHFDVVPVEAGTLDDWEHKPFAGVVDQGFIWGRGTLDCKQGVMGILEALNILHNEGFRPHRTIYVALGHDEELGGRDGNRKLADWMQRNNRRLHAVLDEGGCIYKDFPGMDRPTALVGVAEKGVLNVKLSVDVSASGAGHASMPPPETAIEVLAQAITRIQANPFPARMDAGLENTLAYLAPEMPSLFNRLAMTNLWLFGPLVERRMASKPSSDALLRTTVATTVIAGGTESTILPQRGEATLNLRLLPGDSVESVIETLRKTIRDPRVQLEVQPGSKSASAVSPTDSLAFEQLQRSIHEVYPETTVAPFVLVGSTDSVYYSQLCSNIFRFIPSRLTERDTQRFHGTNERIATQDFLNIVRFYHRFITNVTQKP